MPVVTLMASMAAFLIKWKALAWGALFLTISAFTRVRFSSGDSSQLMTSLV